MRNLLSLLELTIWSVRRRSRRRCTEPTRRSASAVGVRLAYPRERRRRWTCPARPPAARRNRSRDGRIQWREKLRAWGRRRCGKRERRTRKQSGLGLGGWIRWLEQ
uniref:Uncharacterized protein n=1 Tax=Aegilops tauschii subsp. strangulata TaxID=200361 RepID=A0A453DF36_AEGTS